MHKLILSIILSNGVLPGGGKSFQNKIAFNVQHGHSYKRCQKGVFIRYNLLLPKGFLLEVCQRGPHLYVLGSPLSSNLLSVCCFQYKFFHSFHLYSSLATTSNEFELVKHISIQNLLYG